MTRKRRPTRSTYGEGTVYFEQSRAKWVAELNLGGERFRRRYHTKQAAEEGLMAMRKQHQRGIDLHGATVTLADWLEYWIEHIVAPKQKAKTAASYRQICRLYIIPYVGKKRLMQLTTMDIQTFLNQLRKKVSESTVHNAYLRLHTALAVAVKQKQLPDNPARDVEKPTAVSRAISPLTLEQCYRLLETVEGHRLAPLYQTALVTGMRQGELLGLRWSDIDFAQQAIHVRNQIQYVSGQMLQTTPKTRSGNRSIPMSEEHANVLRQHWQDQQEERRLLGTEWKEYGGFVFASEIGTPLHPRNLVRHFKALLQRAGLPNIRFHDLRHTAITLMLKDETAYKEISRLAGHSSIAVTVGIYGHPDQDSKVRVLSTQARTLLGGRK